MAEILQGLEHNVSHAPLSHAQSIAVSRYLHNITQENALKTEDLSHVTRLIRAELETAKGHIRASQSSLVDLRQDLSDRSNDLRACQELAVMNEDRCKRLVNETSSNSENIDEIRSGLKVTNTNVHGLREDSLKHGMDVGALRKDLDNAVHKAIVALRDKVRQCGLGVTQLRDEQAKQRNTLWEDKDRIKLLETDSSEAKAERVRLLDADVAHNILFAEACKRDEDLKVNLELTNGVIMKLHDNLEVSQKFAFDLREQVRAEVARCTKLSENHANTARVTEQNKQEHGLLVASHGTCRTDLEHVTGQLHSLKAGFQSSGTVIKQMGLRLEELRIQATCTEENLKVTNSYVLPNLNTGVDLDPKFSSNSGTCTGGSLPKGNSKSARGAVGGGSAFSDQAGKRGATTKSPGRKAKDKEIWISRNIGLVPDRMAMI